MVLQEIIRPRHELDFNLARAFDDRFTFGTICLTEWTVNGGCCHVENLDIYCIKSRGNITNNLIYWPDQHFPLI